jgi:myo-inositol 2-dehydrogenase / D-chiro-inositol 1-dehydrogenase
VRVAVIGTGSMGGMHASLLSELPGVAEVLVVDANADRAAAVAAETGGRALTHDEAIDAADAIVIATPVPFHAKTVRAAVAAGIPALCEKPLTEDLAEGRALVELVEGARAHVEMGFQRRFEPSFIEARQRIANGATGRVHLVRLTAFEPRVTLQAHHDDAPPEVAPVFLHSSVHDFDMARWLTGSEVVEVMAVGTHRDGGHASDPREIENAAVTLRMANGTLATLDASWLHPGGYDVRMEVIADDAHFSLGLSPRTPAEHLDWPGASADPWAGYLERFTNAYRAELTAFLAAARGEAHPASSVRDGHEALRVAVATTRSHLQGRTVSLSEVA